MRIGALDRAGDPLELKMKYFLEYLRDYALTYDSCISIIEDQFEEKIKASPGQWTVPSFFAENYYQSLPEDLQPTYKCKYTLSQHNLTTSSRSVHISRWRVHSFTSGYARSDLKSNLTWIHCCQKSEPDDASGWNVLLCGRKHWVIFAHDVDPKKIPHYLDENDRNSDKWYETVMPFLRHSKVRWMECMQLPGEIIYVPSGCVHAVLTLKDSIALSVNFVDRHNISLVLRATQHNHPQLAAALQHIDAQHK